MWSPQSLVALNSLAARLPQERTAMAVFTGSDYSDHASHPPMDVPSLGWYASTVRRMVESAGKSWVDFVQFMHGQTVSIVRGKKVYYPCDVQQFLGKAV